jgi:hypothetical protein
MTGAANPLNSTDVRSVSIALPKAREASEVVTDPLPVAAKGLWKVNTSVKLPVGMPVSPKVALTRVGRDEGPKTGETIKKID